MAVLKGEETALKAYRFGAFEVQPRVGTLLRHGKRLRIQELPFQMLLMLLERQGELVTKEDLGTRLWGPETFVEVDKNLYVVAAKLRDVLGDNASSPRFIKTISGRGYRFIGDVTQTFEAPEPPVEVQEVALAELPAPFPVLKPVEARSRNLRRMLAGAGAVLVVFMALGALLYHFAFPRRPLINSQDPIVVGGFSNGTGEPELDAVLSSAAMLKLQESPYLNIVPARRLSSLVANPDTQTLGEQLSACRQLHAAVLLRGQIMSHGSGYRVQMDARRCSDGRQLTAVVADAGTQSTILNALDNVIEKMRWQLGESAESLKKFNVPSMQATTSSLSALRAFTIGEIKRAHGQEADSISYYKLATDLDPQFALAYARLGTLYYNIGEFALSNQNSAKAFSLRERTSDRERLYITSHYYDSVTGEISRTVDAYELWRSMYPRDMTPVNNLAIMYLLEGQPEKTLPLARRAVQLDPVSNQPYYTLSQGYLMTGDFADLNPACARPPAGRSEGIVFHESCFFAAFAQGDEKGMEREEQWAKDKPQENSIVEDEALAAMYEGRTAEARQLFARAGQMALQHGHMGGAADIDLSAAVAQAESGLTREARQNALAAAKDESQSPTTQAIAALVLARCNDTAKAQAEVASLSAAHPQDSLLNSALLNGARAAIELQKHRPENAIRILDSARPYDFNYFLPFATAYLRGAAYLENGQPGEAAQEFHRILQHRTMAPASIYVALAQLESGHALQLAGDTDGARRAFDAANNNWKNADQGFLPRKQLAAYQQKRAR